MILTQAAARFRSQRLDSFEIGPVLNEFFRVEADASRGSIVADDDEPFAVRPKVPEHAGLGIAVVEHVFDSDLVGNRLKRKQAEAVVVGELQKLPANVLLGVVHRL